MIIIIIKSTVHLIMLPNAGQYQGEDGTPMMSGGMGWREPPHPGSTALCSVRGLPGGQVSVGEGGGGI